MKWVKVTMELPSEDTVTQITIEGKKLCLIKAQNEFYVIQNKQGSHHLDGKHTVFGKVTKGMDIVDLIANEPTDEGEYPLMNVKIKIRLK